MNRIVPAPGSSKRASRSPVLSVALITSIVGLLGFLYAIFGTGHETSLSLHTERSVDHDIFQEIQETQENVTLQRRDDYSCSADNPCHNGACCGKSGYCGYGEIILVSTCIARVDQCAR